MGTYNFSDGQGLWHKVTFLVEVQDGQAVVLDPDEHQAHVWASEAEARNDKCGHVDIAWTFPEQKDMALEAFKALSMASKA